ncbi:hypothetical protein [Sphingomonas sanguinis]|nr:hypothetical protein [Sphingomonas sanguinis]
MLIVLAAQISCSADAFADDAARDTTLREHRAAIERRLGLRAFERTNRRMVFAANAGEAPYVIEAPLDHESSLPNDETRPRRRCGASGRRTSGSPAPCRARPTMNRDSRDRPGAG